ncbi:MAG: DUF4401 domain-containing protein [Betaproteobacteria bacterium]
MNLQSLFENLHRDGHIASHSPPELVFAESASPWYTRVLMGFMGWLGGLFVLGFFGVIIASFFDNGAMMMIIAIGLFAGSFAMYRAMPSSDFGTQFALAASICAQVVATLAVAKLVGYNGNGYGIAWFVGLMQVALVIAMPNGLHRLISTLFSVGAFYFAAEKGLLVPALDVVLVAVLILAARMESTLVVLGRRQLVDPVINGLSIALLLRGAAHVSFFGETHWFPFAMQTAVVFSVALVAWAVLNTARLASVPRSAAILAAIVYGAVTWRAPGLIASVLVLLVAFASGRRALTAFSLVALVAYLSTYYYQMHLTLATKSMVLGLSGACLLVMWWVHRSYFSGERA